MRRKLKQMMLALMVGVGMMGAVSIQAQTQTGKVWVRVSDYVDGRGNIGTFDQFCQRYADWRATSAWPVTYLGSYEITVSRPEGVNIGGSLKCSAINTLDNKDYVNAYFDCTKGGFFYLNHPDGCYEQRDTCPEGTKADSEGICVPECWEGSVKDANGNCTCPEGQELTGFQKCEPKCPEGQERNEKGECECAAGFEPFVQKGTRAGQADAPLQCVPRCEDGEVRFNGRCVPEKDPEPPVNDHMCGSRVFFDDDNVGLVACEGDKLRPCSRASNKFKNRRAQILDQWCTVEHEQFHINNRQFDNAACDDKTGTQVAPYPDLYKSEVLAYKQASVICLERSKDQCDTFECIEDLEEAKKRAELWALLNKIYYNDYCAEHNLNCSPLD